VGELALSDTIGTLVQPGVTPERTSGGLGWEHLYLSRQRELPYEATMTGAASHMIVLHLTGPVKVRGGPPRLMRAGVVPRGGLAVQPAGADLEVHLDGEVDTVHAYLTDDVLREVRDGECVQISAEVGVLDPLVEQLVLGLDGVLRHWEPAARTYLDHLTRALAAQLAWRYSVRPMSPPEPVRPDSAGLGDRQLHAVRDLVEHGLSGPLPLDRLAAAANLSVSRFARQFKARMGLTPHQFVLARRVEEACRLLAHSAVPIGEVARRCGFSHQEHLTRVIRARTRTTPATIRREASAARFVQSEEQ
jgi:AraC family transcriptional regulator